MYTLGTAAKATGKTKGTIQKAIVKGRISAQKNDIGEWQIDPAELHRVYPPRQPQSEREETQPTPEGNTLKISLLEAEVHRLNERLADKDGLLEQVRSEVMRERALHDDTRETLAAVRRMLPPPEPVGAMQETESTVKPKKSFVSRLFGG
jgi:hypothetical protein